MPTAATKAMSLKDFLNWEETQEGRYEFVDGRIVAMAGGTVRHDEVRGAIYASLRAKLAGKPCRAQLDIKVVCPNGRARSPDVAIDCGPRRPEMTALSAPTIVVEVLSPKTRTTDYLEKPRDYGSVPTIEAYLIVDPDEPRIDVLRRAETGLELAETAEGREAVIDLSAIGVQLALADIYPA
jgi:Uma2 family endonuclease